MNTAAALFVVCSVVAAQSAYCQIGPLTVGTTKPSIVPGDSVGVTLALTPIGKGLPRKLPQGSRSTAGYTACTASDEHASPAQHPADFCKSPGTVLLADTTGKLEPVDEIGHASIHTFPDFVNLPQSPSGTKVWFVVTFDVASPPDQIHTTSYGFTSLLYRCDLRGGNIKTTKRSCAYWTPPAFAIHQGGAQKLLPVVPKPKP